MDTAIIMADVYKIYRSPNGRWLSFYVYKGLQNVVIKAYLPSGRQLQVPEMHPDAFDETPISIQAARDKWNFLCQSGWAPK
tara:strand:- start:2835 stop:3077 length:243 start_codon:yes stop_codon:yes gene_type:complete